ncbi:MAG: AAA family ATPase [Anaerolineae bacterium]|nr:AAA family ATPase [Anaerolineae bacterium]
MSLVKATDGDKRLSTEKQYAWQTEETLVDRRRQLRYRIMRQFTFWRVFFVVFIGWALLSEGFMLWLTNDALPYIIRLVTVISFAIGQFALIFWFLGRARTYTIWPGTTSEGISFTDYRGQPELLDQAKQIVKLLRGVRVFEEAGGEPLNGLLLEGPPGTGKTWLAKAISTEAGVPFFYIDASSLMSMFMGIAPLKVMNLYRKARNAAKDYGAAIIFIDEIDAIGSRSGMASGATRADGTELSRNRLPIMMGMGSGTGLLSTLLVEMDGFSLEHGWWARRRTWFYNTILRRKPPKPPKRILTIGATNRVQALDAALLRAGRFDKKVRVDAPDLEGRRDIFDYYLSKIAHDESLDSLILASETPYYTPADIKHLLNEALRYALFDGRTHITIGDVRQAQPEHEFGLRSPIKNLAREDEYRLAAHEAGHAIAVRFYCPGYRIARITIIRQGGAHGYVKYYPATEDFDAISTYESMMNRLRVFIGGRAGELEFVGEDAQSLGVGTGFGDRSDFGVIRETLWHMANVGMFGPLGANLRGTNYTPEMTEEMENTFKAVLEDVRIIFRIHREMGEALIKLLLEKKELFADEVEAFFDQYGLYTPKVDLNPYQKTPAVEGKVN